MFVLNKYRSFSHSESLCHIGPVDSSVYHQWMRKHPLSHGQKILLGIGPHMCMSVLESV